MLVLALDTSTAAVSAALVEVAGDAVATRSERRRVDARGHGEYLAPLVESCLASADVTPAGLDAIVVGTGPGPFTGLRVGLVTAAVLGNALDVPAYGVCSLDAIAAGPGGPESGTVLVASDARRKEVYWAGYRDGIRVNGPEVARPADVPTAGFSAAAGAGARLYADVFGLPLLDRDDPDRDYPDPAALVRRTLPELLAGTHPGPLAPLYLRRPDATIPGAPKAVS